jgi:type II secretory pathway component HofQ
VRTESFALSYAKAEDLQKLLTNKDQKILSKRGTATIDERTNTLFVQDTGGRLEEARRLIQQLDVPVRQVLIEARIVIADDKWGKQLGARFGTRARSPIPSTRSRTTRPRAARTRSPIPDPSPCSPASRTAPAPPGRSRWARSPSSST